ncbi:hypothetical protein [Paenibacillus periandrae]|uniref:hypothetical protein n=1 Tax=Paenibacillus periandrae TaxID=1761741 RepID=UPI001F09357E|nr:hypothetical protein [Paenibacillus periandrae]
MLERFKVVIRYNGSSVVHFTETDGEEVFRYKGFRFFTHRYYGKDLPEWRVSCAMSGSAIGWAPFREDAIKMAKKNLHFEFEKYLAGLKNRPKARWSRRPPQPLKG